MFFSFLDWYVLVQIEKVLAPSAAFQNLRQNWLIPSNLQQNRLIPVNKILGSILWKLISAIYPDFRRKKWRFVLKSNVMIQILYN
jgi:hypothetical protein